jgi:hypothetical protein
VRLCRFVRSLEHPVNRPAGTAMVATLLGAFVWLGHRVRWPAVSP